MRISKVELKNFRLLNDVELSFEERTTVIVGRNNSGKTSLTEIFRRVLSDAAPGFNLEDFSLAAYDGFWQAYLKMRAGDAEDEIRQVLPFIDVRLTIDYEPQAPSLGPLGPFIIDLNEDCAKAVILIRYALKDGEIGTFFDGIELAEGGTETFNRSRLYRAIKQRVRSCYVCNVVAIDPNDADNQKPIEWSQFRTLVRSGFINAQRGLDDTTHRDVNLLGKVLEALLTSALAESADARDRTIAQTIDEAIEGIQSEIDGKFNLQLQKLLPAFSIFGYPGLSDPGILTETTLDARRLLKDNTRVQYAGVSGVSLPEAYNGLGVRNLVFILLKLYEFFKGFKSERHAPGIQLVFIEEPEVHLHPQMQEVFINKLGAIVDIFAQEFPTDDPWPVQFVVTTHSSHIANKAPFESIRYFVASAHDANAMCRSTRIKNLRDGLGASTDGHLDFLHKYMTLTRCDLLFADKAVLIEGTSERLLLPTMIDKIDAEGSSTAQLSTQYLSVVEVGGAYAHLFFDLLEFLELRTLIITDLDAIKGKQNTACVVSEGQRTSNACIREWFAEPTLTPQTLIAKSDNEKCVANRRIAYQIPEADGAACGRSFEEAFMLANGDVFEIDNSKPVYAEDQASKMARRLKKSDFALEYAIYKPTWTVPRYIAEGLRWLGCVS